MRATTPLHCIACLSFALLASGLGTVAHGQVLIDSYRGWGDNSAVTPTSPPRPSPRWLPNATMTPYYDNIPRLLSSAAAGGIGADRYAAVQRLLTFAASPLPGTNAVDSGVAGAPAAAAGSTLTKSRANLEIPRGQDVLCEYDRGNPTWPGTTNACRNNIEGAVMYTAVLVPGPGYKVSIRPGSSSNDGAVVHATPIGSVGTDYRGLSYSTKLLAGATIDYAAANAQGYANEVNQFRAPLPVTAANTLLNLRVAWNNWGSDAALVIEFLNASNQAVTLPLYDPSAPATYIAATNDDFTATPLSAGTAGSTASVFGNDRVNVATPVTASNIQTAQLIADPATATPPPAGITLNTDGTLSVAASVAPGTYTVHYQICRTDTQPQPLCATAQAVVQVNASIVPQPDAPPAAAPAIAAGTASTPIANVAANDQVNGAAATLGTSGNATVAESGNWPAGITLDADTGAVHVAPTVASGPQTLNYTLCDKFGNCEDSTIRFTLAAAELAAGNDAGTATAGTDSTPIANVAANDTLNGQPVQLGAGGNATVAPTGNWPAGITLDPDTGAVTVAASVPPGEHTLTYHLCPLSGDPCVDATVTLTVRAAGTGTVAVPTLGQWSLMMLGMLLLLPGLRTLRSRS
ncbi:MAG: hypothetical protein Q4G71_17055 [Pseudomonadota bacterium]|nr:hypothetical protein [Pseudomonadota bacterium]